MANGKIRFGKQSGGQLALVIPDGVSSTEVVVPESGELVNKDYADLKVALASFIGTNQSLGTQGYQKLPGGLIVQWTDGVCSATPNTPVAINLPITFPNRILKFFATSFPMTSYVNCPAATNSSVSISSNIASAGVGIFAIGY